MEQTEKSQMIAPPSLGINFQEIISRLIKYLVEGGAVAIAAYLIPQRKLEWQAVVMIALTAAAVFAILDMFAPAVSVGVRQGSGFALGFGLIGAPGMALPGGVTTPGIPPPMA